MAAQFDINKVKGNDRFIAGGAVIFIILLAFPWRTFSFLGQHHSVKLFGDGSYGFPKLAFLLALLAGGVVIARLMGVLDAVTLPAGVNFITLALSGAATVLLLLQYVLGFGKYVTISGHPGFGYYLGILVSAAMTYFAFLNFKASGEEMPTMPSSGGSATTPPAPGAYPPPVDTTPPPADPFEKS